MDEREAYRMKCKHIGMSDICLRESGMYGGMRYINPKTGECGWYGYIHMTIHCTGDCQRMKRYDKLHKENKQ